MHKTVEIPAGASLISGALTSGNTTNSLRYNFRNGWFFSTACLRGSTLLIRRMCSL
jgi:hypothetical protein